MPREGNRAAESLDEDAAVSSIACRRRAFAVENCDDSATILTRFEMLAVARGGSGGVRSGPK
jgi:hypothetical protein